MVKRTILCIIIVYVFSLCFTVNTVIGEEELRKEYVSQITNANETIKSLKNNISNLNKHIEDSNEKIKQLTLELEKAKLENKRISKIRGEYKTFNVSAYTNGYESTSKHPDDPEYGITASGEYTKDNYTLACPKSIPFNTEIYIPYFDNTFICKDRGSKITLGKLDVYMSDLEKALSFGRKNLLALILEEGEK